MRIKSLAQRNGSASTVLQEIGRGNPMVGADADLKIASRTRFASSSCSAASGRKRKTTKSCSSSRRKESRYEKVQRLP
jgi:hypothetical protein